MALTPAAVVGLVAGATFVITGAALVLLKPARRGILPFGAYAILTGVQLTLVYLWTIMPERTILLFLSWPIMGLSAIALSTAVRSYCEARTFVWAFVGAAGVGAMFALIRPGLMLTPAGGPNDLGVVLWQMPVFVAAAIGSRHLLRAHDRTASAELRTEFLLLLLAIVPHLGYTSSVSLLVAISTPEFYAGIWTWAYILTFGAGVATAFGIARALWRSPSRHANRLALLIGAVTIIGAVQFLLVREFVLFGGVLRILAAIFLGYGLLKYGLFGTDLKVKWSIERGTVFVIIGAVFFGVEQVIEYFASARLGTIAGITAAALMLIAFAPLRNFTIRLADRVLPDVHATPDYFEARKLVVYRSAAQAAARDGVITGRERDMLDTLARELEIAPVEVEVIEREAIGSVPLG